MTDRNPSNWAEIEDFGIVWGMKFLVFVHRYLGRWLLPLFLYPVVAYYWATNRRARHASLDYLQRLKRFAPQAPVQANGWYCFVHFLNFAHSMLDRVSAWTGLLDHDEVIFTTRPEIEQRILSGQGIMMIAAHLGCLEVCTALANQKHDIKLNVLVHTKNARRMNELLQPLNMQDELELIEVTDIGPATTIALVNKVRNGEVVVMVGDRVPVSGDKNTLTTEFLGAPAQFAQGPWVLAHVLKCPVYTLFCLRQPGGYRIHCDLLAEQVKLPRKNRDTQMRVHLQQYVERMQYYCQVAPLQWFNFYPYWTGDSQATTATEPSNSP